MTKIKNQEGGSNKAKLKNLRWKIFKLWLKENILTFFIVLLGLATAYLVSCVWQKKWLLGSHSLNITLAIIIFVIAAWSFLWPDRWR
jgi:hypothetical protein